MGATIDRYLFLEWLKVFALTLGVMVGVLLLESMYDELSDLISYGAGWVALARYFLFLIPSFFPLVLPITFLVSLLMVLGNLHRNNEIIVLRAAGRSLWRISRPFWVAGTILSLLLLYLNAQAVPWSVETSRTIADQLRFSSEAQVAADPRAVGMVDNLAFDNTRDGRLWFMNQFSERAYLGFGVTVFTRDAAGRELTRIMAREAIYDDQAGHWIFLEGRSMEFDANGEPIRAVPFVEKVMPSYTEDARIMLALNKRPKDLSLFELNGILLQVTPRDNPRVLAYQVQYYEILIAPISCLIMVGLAVPFAVAGVRTNPMVGVSKSIGYFLVFYLLSSLAGIFGERALLPPLAAAAIPYGLMMGVGLIFFYRQR